LPLSTLRQVFPRPLSPAIRGCLGVVPSMVRRSLRPRPLRLPTAFGLAAAVALSSAPAAVRAERDGAGSAQPQPRNQWQHTKKYGQELKEMVQQLSNKIKEGLHSSYSEAVKEDQHYKEMREKLSQGLEAFSRNEQTLRAEIPKAQMKKMGEITKIINDSTAFSSPWHQRNGYDRRGQRSVQEMDTAVNDEVDSGATDEVDSGVNNEVVPVQVDTSHPQLGQERLTTEMDSEAASNGLDLAELAASLSPKEEEEQEEKVVPQEPDVVDLDTPAVATESDSDGSEEQPLSEEVEDENDVPLQSQALAQQSEALPRAHGELPLQHLNHEQAEMLSIPDVDAAAAVELLPQANTERHTEANIERQWRLYPDAG